MNKVNFNSLEEMLDGLLDTQLWYHTKGVEILNHE